MTQRAFLFPGQGSQKVGMGLDLFEKTELGTRRFEEANEIMGMDLASLCFNGPKEQLRQTQFTQPSIFVVSVILAELLMEQGCVPLYGAGHSLGEYSALTVAGVFSFEDGMRLVKIRGKSMQEVGHMNPGIMAAIVGLDSERINEICADASEEGIVQPANFNSPDQIVISGDMKAVRKAVRLARKDGALKAIELQVSGAFHSPLMSPAKEAIRQALETSTVRQAEFPVLMNVSAEPAIDPATIKQNLINQLDHPVRWVETIEKLRKLNVEEFVEVGPGRVLQGLNRRIDRSLITSGTESRADVCAFADA